MLLIGDSITEGSQIGELPFPDYDKTWSRMLDSERAGKEPLDTVVMARGDQLSSHAVSAMGEAVSLCGRDTVVLVTLGTNDALTVGTPAAWRSDMIPAHAHAKDEERALDVLRQVQQVAVAANAVHEAFLPHTIARSDTGDVTWRIQLTTAAGSIVLSA